MDNHITLVRLLAWFASGALVLIILTGNVPFLEV
jgi:hypothetical protein